jgi:hypothetical protein
VQDTAFTFQSKATADKSQLFESSCKESKIHKQSNTGFLTFPLSNFKYYLTLFSKFFSSFPHGTCSLSVSRQYLALDEVYHPFSAAIPSNTTLRRHIVRGELRVKDGILTLYDTLFQKIYTQVTADSVSIDYNSDKRLRARFSD